MLNTQSACAYAASTLPAGATITDAQPGNIDGTPVVDVAFRLADYAGRLTVWVDGEGPAACLYGEW